MMATVHEHATGPYPVHILTQIIILMLPSHIIILIVGRENLYIGNLHTRLITSLT
jgi:hypothetical protein